MKELFHSVLSLELSDYLSNDVPDIMIRSVEEQIQDAISDGSIDLSEYDIVVVATGNHNVNRWINDYIINHELTAMVVYSWNEPLDIGCHVAVVDYTKDGDNRDLFALDVNGILYDRTAFCSPNQEITRNLYGCGGSFIPYGSEVSIKAASMAVDVIKRYVTNRVVQNTVLSFKGSGYFFQQAGMKHTERYEKQITSYSLLFVYILFENSITVNPGSAFYAVLTALPGCLPLICRQQTCEPPLCHYERPARRLSAF